MQVATVIGLLMALPMAFIVVYTQVDALQTTAKTVIPAGMDPIFGTPTIIILILCVIIVAFLAIGAGMLMGG